ncbi:MAG: DUF1501 domain-containing protein [Candidatus Hydrogenedentes bacterium]|nr:DUF1501 domain-containing protein [Candidatus Hydrogenedentota bacterium]
MYQHPSDQSLHEVTRRHFFRQCGVGLGSIALGSLLCENKAAAASDSAMGVLGGKGHFPAKAKNVIFMFMAGGPSQLELFDYKPALQKYNGQPIPASYIEGKRFAFMDSFGNDGAPKLLGTVREFKQHGQCGAWVSECLPHTAKIVDNIAFLKTVATDVPNHAPAKVFMNTGSGQFGRPSMGAWINYGIGSESKDLPGFVVLQSGPRGPRGGQPLWGSGFLPAAHQGVPFRSQGDPVLNLSSPEGVNDGEQRQVIDAVNALNRARLDVTGDGEIAARISAYEMAYRMQSSGPELMDLSQESQATLDLYGATPGKPSYAMNCLLARRMVERGVRFVQLYHTNWDHHGGNTENLSTHLDEVCRDVDQASAALVLDLKQRGLLEDTLVIWGGEFGRTPMGEVRDTVGRNHHIECATMWMAGGGVKAGFTLGETDELGFSPVADPVHVHDVQATILHLLGINHERLTYRFQGRDFRLTDVAGHVQHKLLV